MNSGYLSSDDMGTRHDNPSTAEGYWMKRITDGDQSPFVLYHFDSLDIARASFEALPFIKVADDTKQIICLNVLIYGYYSRYDGKVSAVLAGRDFTNAMYEAATHAFTSSGGRLFNEKRPERSTAASSASALVAPDLSKVVFVREETKEALGFRSKQRFFRAPDEATATAYVKSLRIDEPFNQVGVEYPGGIICRDKDGVYKP
jgi:hypothetical protein